MARKTAGERRNESTANVATRRSTRNAAADTQPERIAKATAKAETTKAQHNQQTEVLQSGEGVAAARVEDKEVSPIIRGKLLRKKTIDAESPAEEVSIAPENSRQRKSKTPQPTSKAHPGVGSVSRSAKGTKKRSRDEEGDDSPQAASKKGRVDEGSHVVEDNLGDPGQARSENQAEAPPAEHASGAGMDRRSQELHDDHPSIGPSKGTIGNPRPAGVSRTPNRARSEDSEHESPPPEPSHGQKFGDLLLRGVVTQRALRERQYHHNKCSNLLRETQLEISNHEMRLSHQYMYGEPDTNERDEINQKIKYCEALVMPRRRHDEAIAARKRHYLEHQQNLCTDQILQRYPHVIRESDGLKFLAENIGFWQSFDRLREAHQNLDDHDVLIGEAKQELRALDNETERLYRRVFEFGEYSSVPAIVEANVFGDLDGLPDVMDRFRPLEKKKQGLRTSLTKAAVNLLLWAEDAFIRSGVLVQENVLLHGWGSSEQESSQEEDPLEQDDAPWLEDRPEHDRPDQEEWLEEEDPLEREDAPEREEREGAPRGWLDSQGRPSSRRHWSEWQRREWFERDRWANLHRRQHGTEQEGEDPPREGQENAPWLDDQDWSPPRRPWIENRENLRRRRRLRRQQHPEQDDLLEQEDSSQKDSAPNRPTMREQLDLAEKYLKWAKEDFAGARVLTRTEVAWLPEPVTEDSKGVAMVRKLQRLTRALREATQAWKDTQERARKAGFTDGREQTADFSDREDDGYADSVYERLKEYGKKRVPQDWAGWHWLPRMATPPSAPRTLNNSFVRLQSPRVGEDFFESTEARGRVRDRIDDMMVEAYNIRERGSFQEAEPDELIFERMRSDGI